MSPLRAIIVDDEPRARKGLRTLLASDAQISVVAECADGRSALKAIAAHEPDLLFLDIQMPGLSGFDVLEQLDLSRAPMIVFVTAYDTYALKAFEVNAVDYLLKPFSDQRFFEALERAKSRRQSAEKRLAALRDHHLRRFMIRSGDEVQFVAAVDVDWIEAAAYCAKIHCAGATHLLRGNLGKFERELDPSVFLRISRSTIVNVSRVRALKDWFHGGCMVVLADGTELRAGRSQRKQLESLLQRGPH